MWLFHCCEYAMKHILQFLKAKIFQHHKVSTKCTNSILATLTIFFFFLHFDSWETNLVTPEIMGLRWTHFLSDPPGSAAAVPKSLTLLRVNSWGLAACHHQWLILFCSEIKSLLLIKWCTASVLLTLIFHQN